MWLRSGAPLVCLLALIAACGTGARRDAPGASTPGGSATATAVSTSIAPSPAPSEEGSASPGTAAPSPTAVRAPGPSSGTHPGGERADIRASRLSIPALGIDSQVQASQVIPDTSTPLPGCPPTPPGQETFTVPNYGIATPERQIEGLENKAWIFGHSRWQGDAGLFFTLQDLNVGDELYVDGFERGTGRPVTRQRFIVRGLYLTDIQSGGRLVTAMSPTEIPPKPLVILQTSVREDGPNRAWILNPEKVMAKSRNVVEGDINDPCKYLLLFVFAEAA